MPQLIAAALVAKEAAKYGMMLRTVPPLAYDSGLNVRYGSLAGVRERIRDVRFTPNNGRWAAYPSLHLAVGFWVHALG